MEFLAYRKLRKLKHEGSLREYVKEYSALLLEIPDMAEREALFGFLDGLQPWAARELQSKGVKDMATALAEAEKLEDFKAPEKPKGGKNNHAKGGGDHPKWKNQTGKSSPATTDDERSETESRKKKGNHERRPSSSKKNGKGDRGLQCFLCNGPHFARHCPQREKLSAMKRSKSRKGSDSESSSEENAQLGCVQLLGAVTKKNSKKEEVRSIKKKDVLYADVRVNGHPSKALIDTGATHNFVSVEEAKRLDLKVKQDKGWSKPVNSEAKPIHGVVHNADIAIGGWTGQVEFSVIEMDDHPMMLGMDFLRKSLAIPIPHMATMLLLSGEAPCSVPLVGRSQLKKEESLAAVQQEYDKGKGMELVEPSKKSYLKAALGDAMT